MLKREKIVKISLLLLLASSLYVFPVSSLDNDDSTGSMEIIGAINNPSIYLDWFYTYEIIIPLIDVQFNVTVYDQDNVSDELIVILYYSNSFFQTNNVSVLLEYQVENSPHNYTYNYTLVGQISTTHIYYYYTVYDGLTLQRKPLSTDEYYDVLWLADPVTIIRYNRDKKIVEQIIDVSPLVVVLILMFVVVMIVKSKNKTK